MPRADGVAEVGLARVRAQREVRVPDNIFVMLINIFVWCQRLHGAAGRVLVLILEAVGEQHPHLCRYLVDIV